jgi:Raf kinase inhibitor-like YbhB/YbcL family protein
MNTLRTASFPLTVAALAALSACGVSDMHPLVAPGHDYASITLTSRAFVENGTIPIDYTCDGKGASPPLSWSSPPEGTKTLALLLEDSDMASRTHWVVYNLPLETSSLPEGSDVGALGAKLGMNASNDVAYSGPCPPRRELHRYVFHVFAVDTSLTLPEGSRRQAFDAALTGHVLGEGTLTGLAAR